MIQPGTHGTPRLDLGEAFHEFSLEGIDLIATDILPALSRRKKKATFKAVKRKNFRIPNVTHANGAAFKRVTLYMDDISYECTDKGLEALLTDDDRENYDDDFDAEVETIQGIKAKMLLAREQVVATAIFNTTTWTGASLYTDNSGSPWDTATTDIILQVNAAKEKVRTGTGVKANTLIIGEAAMQNLLKNDDIIGRFPGAALITEAMIRANMAAIFGLQRLLVGSGSYNSADEGQSASMADLWSDDYAMVAVLAAGSGTPMTVPQLGRTISWSAMPEIEAVKEYREEQTESDVYRVRDYSQHKIIDSSFAHLMKIDA